MNTQPANRLSSPKATQLCIVAVHAMWSTGHGVHGVLMPHLTMGGKPGVHQCETCLVARVPSLLTCQRGYSSDIAQLWVAGATAACCTDAVSLQIRMKG